MSAPTRRTQTVVERAKYARNLLVARKIRKRMKTDLTRVDYVRVFSERRVGGVCRVKYWMMNAYNAGKLKRYLKNTYPNYEVKVTNCGASCGYYKDVTIYIK